MMTLRLVVLMVGVASLAATQSTGDANVRCLRPMCMMYCDMGFKTDSDGCPICECLQDPCLLDERQVCPADTQCTPKDCTSHPCTELGAHCEGVPMCAMPMCSNICPDGYMTNEMGCMTCTCRTPQSCDEKNCRPDLVCQMNGDSPQCLNKPLCHRMLETVSMLRGGEPVPLTGFQPECEQNGDFKPTQCSPSEMPVDERECWCVDDRGKELDGTRASINDQMACEKRKTQLMHVEVTMIHEFVDIEEYLDDLETPIKQHVSEWLTIDEEMINIVEITPNGDVINEVYVHITVTSDGLCDLPSAAHTMQQLLSRDTFIPYLDKTLQPKADSLKFTHEYEKSPELNEPEVIPPEIPAEQEARATTGCFARFGNYYGEHKLTVILSCVGALVILICLVGICVLVSKMKRRSYQFKHKRLENMENFKKNLVLASDMEPASDLSGEKKEKAAEIAVTVA